MVEVTKHKPHKMHPKKVEASVKDGGKVKIAAMSPSMSKPHKPKKVK